MVVSRFRLFFVVCALFAVGFVVRPWVTLCVTVPSPLRACCCLLGGWVGLIKDTGLWFTSRLFITASIVCTWVRLPCVSRFLNSYDGLLLYGVGGLGLLRVRDCALRILLCVRLLLFTLHDSFSHVFFALYFIGFFPWISSR